MSWSRYRIRTTKAEIARYWLDSSEGIERLPANHGFEGIHAPCCFACGFDAVGRDVWSEGWLGWNSASLDRCHLVPRQLGGGESPSNLVLLCNRCHRDAPNVGDPAYMLHWIAEREDHITTMFSLIRATIDRADLEDTINSFSRADLDESDRLFRFLLRRWTGLHGSYMTDSTLEAAIVETVRRVAAGKATSAVVCPPAGQNPNDRDDEAITVAQESDAPVADAQPILG